MGTLNFYLDLKADDRVLTDMLRRYEQNDTCKALFGLGRMSAESEYSAGIEAYIDDFLPVCHLLYDLLLPYAADGLWIRANGRERPFDMACRADLVRFMDEAWGEAIDRAYARYGVLVAKYPRYYRTRNRLYRKHYLRFMVGSCAK